MIHVATSQFYNHTSRTATTTATAVTVGLCTTRKPSTFAFLVPFAVHITFRRAITRHRRYWRGKQQGPALHFRSLNIVFCSAQKLRSQNVGWFRGYPQGKIVLQIGKSTPVVRQKHKWRRTWDVRSQHRVRAFD